MTIQTLVLDTSPFLKGQVKHDLAEKFVCCERVLEEVRSKKSREELSLLPIKIHTIEPTEEFLKKAKMAAVKTGDISSLSTTDLFVIALTIQLHEESQASSNDDSDQDSEGEWVTPQNIKKFVPIVKSVACMTSDFAIQNVLLSLELPVFSLDAQKVVRKKTFVLRCYACFKITQDMEKKFCPSCGGPYLTKTSANVDSNGQVKVFLKKNYVYNLRGSKFPIPAPQIGKNAQNIVLREDQSEFLKWEKKKKKRQVVNPFDPDYIPSMFQGLSLNDRLKQKDEIVIGCGKHNPNEARRKK